MLLLLLLHEYILIHNLILMSVATPVVGAGGGRTAKDGGVGERDWDYSFCEFPVSWMEGYCLVLGIKLGQYWW